MYNKFFLRIINNNIYLNADLNYTMPRALNNIFNTFVN